MLQEAAIQPKRNSYLVGAPAIKGNIQSAIEREVPELKWLPENKEKLLIVGGGPSVEKNLNAIKQKQRQGAWVWAVNKAHDYLIENGIKPHACVLLDADPVLSTRFTPEEGVIYFVASQCSPNVWDKLEGYPVIRWHCENRLGWEDMVLGEGKVMVNGGSTCALRAISIGYIMGVRDFTFYGLDSSFSDKTHVYDQEKSKNYKEHGKLYAEFNGKKYLTNIGMYWQAYDYITCYLKFSDLGARVRAIGEGLIPDIYKAQKIRYVLNEELKEAKP